MRRYGPYVSTSDRRPVGDRQRPRPFSNRSPPRSAPGQPAKHSVIAVQHRVSPQPPHPQPFQTLTPLQPPHPCSPPGHPLSTRSPAVQQRVTPRSATGQARSLPGHPVQQRGTESPPNRSPNPGERPKPPPIRPPEHRLRPQNLRSHPLSDSPTAAHPRPAHAAKPREPTPFPRSPPPIPQNDISPAVNQRGRPSSSLQAPAVGFEPTTRRLTVACSTTELSRNFPATLAAGAPV